MGHTVCLAWQTAALSEIIPQRVCESFGKPWGRHVRAQLLGELLAVLAEPYRRLSSDTRVSSLP